MKKIIAVFLLSSILFAQTSKLYKTVVFPGCEKYQTNEELIGCFNQTTKLLIESYFKSNQNLFEYFQTPDFNEKASFQINTSGEYVFHPNESNSELFSFIVKDVFRVMNVYLKNNNQFIKPVELPDGSTAALNFNLPIVFKSSNKISVLDKNPIRFTLNSNQKFTVRQTKDFKFMVYNEKDELIETLNSLVELVSNPLIIGENENNLVVDKEVNGKQIKIIIAHLFRNVRSNFLVRVYENNVKIAEYKKMGDFAKSKYAKYIY